LQKCFTAVNFPRRRRGYKNVVNIILHETTAYLQHVFNMIKHFKNILEVVACKIKQQNIFTTFLQTLILHVTTA